MSEAVSSSLGIRVEDFTFKDEVVIQRGTVSSDTRREYLDESPTLARMLMHDRLIRVRRLSSSPNPSLTEANKIVLVLDAFRFQS